MTGQCAENERLWGFSPCLYQAPLPARLREYHVRRERKTLRHRMWGAMLSNTTFCTEHNHYTHKLRAAKVLRSRPARDQSNRIPRWIGESPQSISPAEALLATRGGSGLDFFFWIGGIWPLARYPHPSRWHHIHKHTGNTNWIRVWAHLAK